MTERHASRILVHKTTSFRTERLEYPYPSSKISERTTIQLSCPGSGGEGAARTGNEPTPSIEQNESIHTVDSLCKPALPEEILSQNALKADAPTSNEKHEKGNNRSFQRIILDLYGELGGKGKRYDVYSSAATLLEGKEVRILSYAPQKE